MSYFHYQSKKIYYKEIGSGKPLVMLHGDTASSRMFELLLPLYQENFRVILMDFLGERTVRQNRMFSEESVDHTG